MTNTTRSEWNKLATEKVSEIVGGFVEVVLTKNGEFSIYAEAKEIAEKARDHFEGAGAKFLSFQHYPADEDGGEAFNYMMAL